MWSHHARRDVLAGSYDLWKRKPIMPRPRKYIGASVAKKQMAYRLRKAGHVDEGVCSKCTEEFGRRMDCLRFAHLLVSAEKKREAAAARGRAVTRKVLGYDLLDEFATLTGSKVTDYETTRAVWRRHAVTLHPDRTGNHEAAAEFNSLWEKIKKLKGWETTNG